MRLLKFISEAVPLSLIRQYKDDILAKKYKTYLDHVFKGEDRIYIDFVNDTDVTPLPDIKKYIEQSSEYEIVDYKKGLAINKKGRIMKIGKLLAKSPELAKMFATDKRRAGSKKNSYKIVISRHPYDLAGMSTGRGWTSCMSLDKRTTIPIVRKDSYGDDVSLDKAGHPIKSNCRYIARDIKAGTIIAYIINANDENIEKPIGRILMKPYINIDNPQDIILHPENKIYGTNVPGFKERIIKWLETIQTVKDSAIYKLNPTLYKDDIPTLLGKGKEDKK